MSARPLRDIPVGYVGGGDVEGGGGVLLGATARAGGGGAVGHAGEHARLPALVALLRQTLQQEEKVCSQI
jgi:hypothetical protein